MTGPPGPGSAERQLFHRHAVPFGDYRLVEGLHTVFTDIALPLLRPVDRLFLVTAMARKTLIGGVSFFIIAHL
jgi:hypothetical protein